MDVATACGRCPFDRLIDRRAGVRFTTRHRREAEVTRSDIASGGVDAKKRKASFDERLRPSLRRCRRATESRRPRNRAAWPHGSHPEGRGRETEIPDWPKAASVFPLHVKMLHQLTNLRS